MVESHALPPRQVGGVVVVAGLNCVGHVLHGQAHGCHVLFLRLHALGVILVDFLHEFDLFLLEPLQLLLGLLLVFAHLHDGLSLFGVYACQFVLPVLHVLLLGHG